MAATACPQAPAPGHPRDRQVHHCGVCGLLRGAGWSYSAADFGLVTSGIFGLSWPPAHSAPLRIPRKTRSSVMLYGGKFGVVSEDPFARETPVAGPSRSVLSGRSCHGNLRAL